MTGVQGKDGVGGPKWKGRPAPRHRKGDARSKIFRELVHIAAEQGASISLGISTAEALQECLDRAVALYRFAAAQVDMLHNDSEDDRADLSNLPVHEDPLFEVIPNPQGPDLVQPHRYLMMEREARLEIEKLAAMMTQLGIAERVVRVREAEAALLVAKVREAAINAGLTNDQIRSLGTELRHLIENPEAPLQKRSPRTTDVQEGLEVNRSLRDTLPEANLQKIEKR